MTFRFARPSFYRTSNFAPSASKINLRVWQNNNNIQIHVCIISITYLQDTTTLFVPNEHVAGPSQPLSDITNENCPSTLENIIEGPSGIKSSNIIATENENFLKFKKYLSKICLLKRQLKRLRNKQYLLKLSTKYDVVKRLSAKISMTFALLLQAQVRNFKKSAKGRRWTKEDKISALRLYKRSCVTDCWGAYIAFPHLQH